MTEHQHESFLARNAASDTELPLAQGFDRLLKESKTGNGVSKFQTTSSPGMFISGTARMMPGRSIMRCYLKCREISRGRDYLI